MNLQRPAKAGRFYFRVMNRGALFVLDKPYTRIVSLG